MTSPSLATEILYQGARNNAWANARLHAACAQLSDADYKATRTGFFPSIHLTFTHILLVDWYYIDAVTEGGRGRSVYEPEEPFAALAPLTAAQRVSDLELVRFCHGLTEADLGRKVLTIREEEGALRETIGDLLLHLFQHQIHHRAQAHTMLAGTAVPPPQLDEFYLEMDRKRRDEEMAALGL